MPQMSPLKWFNMFILFTIILLMFYMINYFNFNIKNESMMSKNKTMNFNKNWKW